MGALLRRLRSSVRVRVTAAVVVIVAIVLGLGAAVFIRAIEHSVVAQVEAQNGEAIRFVRRSLLAGTTGPVAVPGTSDRVITVRDVDGTLIATTQLLANGEPVLLALADDTAGALAAGAAAGAAAGDGAGAEPAIPTDYITTSALVPGAVGGSGDSLVITAATPATVAELSFDTIRDALLLVVPMLVALAGGATWLLVGRSLRPVATMTRQVTELSAQTLDHRLAIPSSHDEIGRLATTMNDLLERLERARRREQQFVADASHELRSPVASIRTQIEVAAMTEASWDQTAPGLLSETDRIDGIVGDLLALARGEVPVDQRQDVELYALVTAEAERSRACPVTVEGDRPLVVVGDPGALTRVLRHLLDNAARHARSTVRVELRTKDSGAVIEVDDDGNGIAPADRQRVFERFVRLDEGRSRDAGGAGLGLAVVADVTARHGGSVRVEVAELGGARLSLTLPLAAS